MLIIWPATPTSEFSSSRPERGVPRLTAITRVAPRLRATSIPRFRTSPPSTSIRPSSVCGANMPGTDMLARTAAFRLPPSITTILPVSMSVAIARNGMPSVSKEVRVSGAPSSDCRKSSNCWPITAPAGNTAVVLRTPSSAPATRSRSSSLLRTERLGRSGWSPSTTSQWASRIAFSILSTETPDAHEAPTIAPMLVPATQSIGTRISSNTRSTPTCAAPRAPPPLSTRQVRGSLAASAGATGDTSPPARASAALASTGARGIPILRRMRLPKVMDFPSELGRQRDCRQVAALPFQPWMDRGCRDARASGQNRRSGRKWLPGLDSNQRPTD